jgi:hypothetical protein
MKKILIATAVLAGFTFAAAPTPPVDSTKAPKPPVFDTAKIDSLRKVRVAFIDSAVKADKVKDSILIADLRKAVPDSIKGKIDTANKGWKVATGKPDSAKVDSLKKAFTAQRDSLISKIKDTATQAKIKARIAALEADRAALKAKIDARKAEIDAKIADLKKKLK